MEEEKGLSIAYCRGQGYDNGAYFLICIVCKKLSTFYSGSKSSDTPPIDLQLKIAKGPARPEASPIYLSFSTRRVG